MFLAKQYFEDQLAFIKQQDCIISRTEKKSNHSKHMKGFQLLEAVIFSLSGQIHFDWKILPTSTWKLFWKMTCKVNSYLTQNQNEFQVPARHLLGNSSVNIKFTMNPLHRSI